MKCHLPKPFIFSTVFLLLFVFLYSAYPQASSSNQESLEEQLKLSDTASLSLARSLTKAQKSLTELYRNKIRNQILISAACVCAGLVTGVLIR